MKKGLPKAQKGLAKLAKVIKTASKTSGNVSKKMQAPPIVRKAKRIASAQKSLSASALGGMNASQLRAKLSALMQEASAASKGKSSAKKLAFKQKGGVIGKALPKAQFGPPVMKPKKYMGRLKPGLRDDMDPKVIKAKKELAKRKAGLKTTDYAGGFKKNSAKIKSKMQKGGSISGKPPVPKEATSRRARKISGRMLNAITEKQPRSKRQLLKKKPGMGAILPTKLIQKQKGGNMNSSMAKDIKKFVGKPKKLKAFVGKRKISETAAKRKVAKGKGMISYRIGGKDPGPGTYNKLSKKKKQFGNTGFSSRSLKGKGRTIRKKS